MKKEFNRLKDKFNRAFLYYKSRMEKAQTEKERIAWGAKIEANKRCRGFLIEEMKRLGFEVKSDFKEVCGWRFDDIEGHYITSCGRRYEFTYGNLKENEFWFCYYCGKQTKEIKP